MSGAEVGTSVEHANPWFSVTRREVAGQPWFRVVRPDSAMMIATDDIGRILVVRGVRDTTGPDACIEFPCGSVDEGEDPAAAAVRETAEEAGVLVTDPRRIGGFVESPGISAAVCHVFTGRIGDSVPQRLEPGEAWTARLLDADGLQAAVGRGTIRDAGTLAALSLFEACRRQVE
ncbi:NUDIX hydrolase [Plantibacter sp. YIM 135249]|uniref:NUDIX hydrolase n=1 Tax=Plantibacter sp. YIM 135249 TaxID=3423918 RepID=UPI003D3407BA